MLRPHVLHVTDCYDAGVFTAINTLVALTPELSHSLLFLGRSKPPRGLFKSAKEMAGKNPIRNVIQAREMINELNCDVLHIHSSRMGALFRLVRIPIPRIYQPHGLAFNDPNFPRFARWVIRIIETWLARKSEYLLAVSHFEKQALESLASKTTVRLLPNTSSLKPHKGIEVNKRVLMVGRVTELKGPRFFAELASKVHESNPEIKFIWIGSGELVLTEILEKAGVEVTGWVVEPKMKQLLSLGGVYTHTSSSEGFPISILDAAQSDLPIIIRDIPHLEGYGLLATPSPDLMAETVKRTFESEEFRTKLLDVSQSINRFHSPDNIKSIYNSIIEEIRNEN